VTAVTRQPSGHEPQSVRWRTPQLSRTLTLWADGKSVLDMARATAMPLDISFQPMRVLIDGHDSEGKLILADGQLAAVIARLDGKAHPSKHKGWWHLEAGLGKCAVRTEHLFKTPEEAGDWVRRRLTEGPL
jgi:hypothetical protein